MEEIAISKFKATCLEVLERVRRTRKPILVTRFGEPVAEVAPPSISGRKGKRLGAMVGPHELKAISSRLFATPMIGKCSESETAARHSHLDLECRRPGQIG